MTTVKGKTAAAHSRTYPKKGTFTPRSPTLIDTLKRAPALHPIGFPERGKCAGWPEIVPIKVRFNRTRLQLKACHLQGSCVCDNA
jgi:hypothetical protein